MRRALFVVSLFAMTACSSAEGSAESTSRHDSGFSPAADPESAISADDANSASDSVSDSGSTSDSGSVSDSGAAADSGSASDSADPATDTGPTPSGPPTADQLLALTAKCTVASAAKYATDEGGKETIDICSLTGAFFWKADMDIDCDGKTTSACSI